MKTLRINGMEIVVCGMWELPPDPDAGITHVVSIHGADFREDLSVRDRIGVIFPGATIRFVFFDDVRTMAATHPPTESDVSEILGFTRPLDRENRLLVHCAMGISRSTAIAFAVLCRKSLPGDEAACMKALMRARPFSVPNPLITRHADGLLERNGAMIRAKEAIRA